MALLRCVVPNARNASWTTSTPSAWCRNACRKRLQGSLNLSLLVEDQNGLSIEQTLPSSLYSRPLGLTPPVRSSRPARTHSDAESSARIERSPRILLTIRPINFPYREFQAAGRETSPAPTDVGPPAVTW